jgi:hypothetical protein
MDPSRLPGCRGGREGVEGVGGALLVLAPPMDTPLDWKPLLPASGASVSLGRRLLLVLVTPRTPAAPGLGVGVLPPSDAAIPAEPCGGEVAEAAACSMPAPLGERTTAVAALFEPRARCGTCMGTLAEGSDASGCMPLLLLDAAPGPALDLGLLAACNTEVPVAGEPIAAEVLLPDAPDSSAPMLLPEAPDSSAASAAKTRPTTGLLVGGEPSVGTPTAGELPGDTSRCR